MAIHPATDSDRDTIWEILEPMIRSGETYTLPRDMSKQQALEYWCAPEKETFVWKEDGVELHGGVASRGRCACIRWSEPESAAFARCNSTLW